MDDERLWSDIYVEGVKTSTLDSTTYNKKKEKESKQVKYNLD